MAAPKKLDLTDALRAAGKLPARPKTYPKSSTSKDSVMRTRRDLAVILSDLADAEGMTVRAYTDRLISRALWDIPEAKKRLVDDGWHKGAAQKYPLAPKPERKR